MKLFKPQTLQKVSTSPNTQIRSKVTYVKPTQKDSIERESYLSLSNVPTNRLRVGYYSTWKVACGIAIYTEHLVTSLLQHCTVFAYPHTMSIHELIKVVDIDRIHILNIQYEPAIMPTMSDLLFLIRELHNRHIKVIFTMHSENEQIKLLANKVDAFIYHKTPQYISDKAYRLPMAVPVFYPSDTRENIRNKYGLSLNSKIITTTGFMFTWKQHANVLEEMVPYLNNNRDVTVQLLTTFNSVNPDECTKENIHIKNIINDHNLDDRVVHITEFLSQQELSERLWCSDLGYLWSGISTTSSSAAGKEFITSRLPLVTTTSSHYHDLSDGVVKTDMNKTLFVEKIFDVLHDNAQLYKLSNEFEILYSTLNYDTLINKHLEIFLL